MKILKLELQNLASLDRAEGETINFEEGALRDSNIFSIVGPTGSGKSTILDAICLALYNRAPRYPLKKGDRKQKIEIFGEEEAGEKNRLAPTDPRNIITRGKKNGYSKLTFRANNGFIYRAEWWVNKKSKNYENAVTSLFRITAKDGKPKEEPAEWNSLPEIIGLDYDQFLRTVLIAQGSFASFLKTKDEDRFVLLEKLVGCEELYSRIAAEIKQQKEEAVQKYTEITANFSAQEKDIISEDEIEAVLARISELEVVENQTKEQLATVLKQIEWFAAEEKYQSNIIRYEEAFEKAKRELADFQPQSGRLALHDATLPAVELFRDIKNAENKIADLQKKLKSYSEQIDNHLRDIKTQEEILAQLNLAAQKAGEEIETQRPNIRKAGEIKTFLQGLKKELREKERTLKEVKILKERAEEELKKNETAIVKAQANLKIFTDQFSKLEAELNAEEKIILEKLEEAVSIYNRENAILEKYDIVKLQGKKESASKALSDLNLAIENRRELKAKCLQRVEKIDRQDKLSKENKLLTEKIEAFDIEKLKEEWNVLNKTYVLMTSENWTEHRGNLQDEEPCPLCGSRHHPYKKDENLKPVIDEMKILLDEKKKHIDSLIAEKERLTGKLAENKGLTSGLIGQLKTLEDDIAKLEREWEVLHSYHENWPSEEKELSELKPQLQKEKEKAEQDLNHYQDLSRKVNKLLREKEKADQSKQDFDKRSLAKKTEGDKKINQGKILLETEKGKTENLRTQQNEKRKALETAVEIYDNTLREIEEKEKALKEVIGDKDPDLFEKALIEIKEKADRAVEEKKETVGKLKLKLGQLKGEEEANKGQLKAELELMTGKQTNLSEWMTTFNEGKAERLSLEDINSLYSSKEDWEAIRSNLKRITETFTISETTLVNEKKSHEAHREKMPDETREELMALKTELESRRNDELIEIKARMQRHENAKKEMGAMFAEKQNAEIIKKEWEEIAKAMGADGKTLRKIAQCYTLRFLVEHANVEIRKFNSRYELQHVKNSLGIRVIDHDRADDIRDTTSLSGGETFIVSLGLALGLSSLSSRNISFENLFIDEGFGTLDPDTLETVIDSLAMLQTSQGKKVCVISHTDSMSERIATQIRIVKQGNSGSSHIEIYP